jgi:hypothetical protein
MEQHHEDDDSDVDSHLSGGIGISYSSGIISIDSTVATQTWVSTNFDNSGNDYVSSASGSGDGTLTLTRTDGGTVTADLSHTHSEYNTYTDSDVDSHLSGGTGISYVSGVISIDSTVATET